MLARPSSSNRLLLPTVEVIFELDQFGGRKSTNTTLEDLRFLHHVQC
jgi:hypothetical protein